MDFQELSNLVSAYPSHSYVIDRCQTESIFKNVRRPSENEIKLAQLLGRKCVVPRGLKDRPVIICLSDEPNEDSQKGGTIENPTPKNRNRAKQTK